MKKDRDNNNMKRMNRSKTWTRTDKMYKITMMRMINQIMSKQILNRTKNRMIETIKKY